MARYIYQFKDWPIFQYDRTKIVGRLAAARHVQGRVLGRTEGLGFPLRARATLRSLTEEILKSSEIEGETLDREQVRSSIARRMGVDIGALTPADRNVEGIVEMMLDANQKFDDPVTKARLFDWHAALFPTARSGMRKITTGAWRKDTAGPMQVVSGPIGREWVHFQAPAASHVDNEMRAFLKWLNADFEIDLVLKAGIAHLWFVTIHPFEDGNGRIARALTDLLLAKSEQSSQRFYSMSAQIRKERNEYYARLEATQKSKLDITSWLEWFLGCFERACDGAELELSDVLSKARFWDRNRDAPLNDRQRLLVNRLIDGFEGKLTSSKWAKIAKCSPDTALRDIDGLIAQRILIKDTAGGRSTSYSLVDLPPARVR